MSILIDVCIDGWCASHHAPPTTEVEIDLCDKICTVSDKLRIDCEVGDLIVCQSPHKRKGRVEVSGTARCSANGKLSLSCTDLSSGGHICLESNATAYAGKRLQTIVEVPSCVSSVSVHADGSVFLDEFECEDLEVRTSGEISCTASASSYFLQTNGIKPILFAPELVGDAEAELNASFGHVAVAPRNAAQVKVNCFLSVFDRENGTDVKPWGLYDSCDQDDDQDGKHVLNIYGNGRTANLISDGSK